MNKDFKQKMVHETLIILSILAFFTFMFRLWPLLILVVFCIILGAVRLLFLKVKEVTASPVQENKPKEPEKLPTEKDVFALAYSVILTRISELVLSEYPTAKWVWAKSNTRKLIEAGEDVYIILNGAGGYRKGKVEIKNLSVVGITYVTPEPKPEPGIDASEDEEVIDAEPKPVNYELFAFEWVEAHIVELNDRFNDAIGQGKKELVLMAEELPTVESWENICSELIRAGLEKVELIPEGIKINLVQ